MKMIQTFLIQVKHYNSQVIENEPEMGLHSHFSLQDSVEHSAGSTWIGCKFVEDNI